MLLSRGLTPSHQTFQGHTVKLASCSRIQKIQLNKEIAQLH